MTTPCRSIPLRLRILCLTALLLHSIGSNGNEINVPLTLDHSFLRNLLLEKIYTDPNRTALIFDPDNECSSIVLSDPQIGSDAGRIRVVTAVNARLGHSIAGRCWHLPHWRGLVEIFKKPHILPERPTIELRIEDSNFLDSEGNKPIITGTLWDWIKQHVHPRLDRLKVDLNPSLQEIQELVPLMISRTDTVQRSIESVRITDPQTTEHGVTINLRIDIPDRSVEPRILPAEPALTAAEAERWESAWQRWDAFLTFVIKRAAKDTESSDLHQALLEVLIDGRYDLSEALTVWAEGTPDTVRGLFLKSWAKLSPLLRRMETSLPGAKAIRYLSFIAAADALKAMDQVGEKIGFEISADGLRRLARTIAPEYTEDPLIYNLEVDTELRRLFGFGPPLSSLPLLPEQETSNWFFLTSALANEFPDRALVDKLNQWVPKNDEIMDYLPYAGDLLKQSAETTIQVKGLTPEYHGFFRHLTLATAWQESCWRQFIRKSGQIKPLTSSAGAVGIVQVNPTVWRGFYEIPSLRKNIAYNASAGNEILHHYLVDYVFAKGEHKKRRSIDHLARLAYVAYNGGPRHFERYRKGLSSRAFHQLAANFWQKYQAVKKRGVSAVAACFSIS